MFDWLNNYHPNIKLTTEVNPSKFLDTKFTNINGAYKFNVYWKNTKLSSPQTSKTLKCYKWNTINGEGWLWRLITNCISLTMLLMNFKKDKECGDENFIILPSLFEITKPFIFIEIPSCEQNEIRSKHFLKKFHKFTNNSFRMV